MLIGQPSRFKNNDPKCSNVALFEYFYYLTMLLFEHMRVDVFPNVKISAQDLGMYGIRAKYICKTSILKKKRIFSIHLSYCWWANVKIWECVEKAKGKWIIFSLLLYKHYKLVQIFCSLYLKQEYRNHDFSPTHHRKMRGVHSFRQNICNISRRKLQRPHKVL